MGRLTVPEVDAEDFRLMPALDLGAIYKTTSKIHIQSITSN
jgi:hypothetical protein